MTLPRNQDAVNLLSSEPVTVTLGASSAWVPGPFPCLCAPRLPGLVEAWLDDPDLSPVGLALLLRIYRASHASGLLPLQGSHSSLGDALGISRWAVARPLPALERAGWLHVMPGPERRRYAQTITVALASFEAKSVQKCTLGGGGSIEEDSGLRIDHHHQRAVLHTAHFVLKVCRSAHFDDEPTRPDDFEARARELAGLGISGRELEHLACLPASTPAFLALHVRWYEHDKRHGRARSVGLLINRVQSGHPVPPEVAREVRESATLSDEPAEVRESAHIDDAAEVERVKALQAKMAATEAELAGHTNGQRAGTLRARAFAVDKGLWKEQNT